VSWDSRFAQPIELPGGVRLASLREAIAHLINTVPPSERGTPVILTAAELITSAAERGGPIEFARIATLRALNRHVERVLNPDILRSRISTSFRERRRPNTLDPLHLVKEYPAGVNRRVFSGSYYPQIWTGRTRQP
jgi:hypothetical protein